MNGAQRRHEAEARRTRARVELAHAVLEAAGKSRHPIPDSDLDDEQPATFTVTVPLGLLRRAGMRYSRDGAS